MLTILAFLPYRVLSDANSMLLSGAYKITETFPSTDRKVRASTTSPMKFYKKVLKGDPFILTGDTLIVGDIPAETLRITGTWTYSGTIFVVNDGVLIFDNTNATIDGNLFLMGNGKVMVDSSSLYFPQRFNYQYGIIVAENSEYRITNSETFFNGFVIGVAVVDSARFVERNVRNRDFTTFAAFGDNPYIEAEYTDNVGEIVVGRRGRYVIRHSDTLLIWHRFPPACTVDVVFPSVDTVYHYVFDSSLVTVSGIDYSILIDTTTGVMWGMMVEDSSSVNIAGSNVRSVGLLFRGSDTTTVSGIVNGSYYTSYTVPLSDRYLHFNNTYVNTFSLYPMDSVLVNVSSSILGEILPMDYANVEVNGVLVDGSGGYLGSSGYSVNITVFSSITTNLQSSENSILIFAYSSQAGVIGQVIAANNSIMAIVQSSLLDYPVVYDRAFAWVSNVRTPGYLPLESSVPVEGDAYGEAGPLGSFLSFSSYSLYYQRSGDTAWVPIVEDVTTPVKDGVLGVWDTHGLTPGTYLLKLKTVVSTGDSVIALRMVNLGTVGVNERENAPLPFRIKGRSLYYPGRYEVYDVRGRRIFSGSGKVTLHRGVYFVKVGERSRKVIVR